MKTKVQIIQELLESSKITAEDAMVLLMKDPEFIYIPQVPIYPQYPFTPPVNPWPWNQPFYCDYYVTTNQLLINE